MRDIEKLTDIPNVGPATASDLVVLDILKPAALAGRDAFMLYDELCERTGVRHDPCVIDVFMAAIRYVEGEPERPWWHYTAERKRLLEARRVSP